MVLILLFIIWDGREGIILYFYEFQQTSTSNKFKLRKWPNKNIGSPPTLYVHLAFNSAI